MDQELALELYELCKAEQPDMQRAEELIRSGRIDLSAPANPDGTGCYLTEAIEAFNYEIAELLLKNGTDPNSRAEQYGWALWLVTRFYEYFLEEEPKANPLKHLKTARLLLEYGADPNGLEGVEEPVLDDVVWSIFNDLGSDDVEYDYAIKAVILMAAYGAATDYCKPRILKPLDKEHTEQYSFHLGLCEDGYHLFGIVKDPNGEVVAYI